MEDMGMTFYKNRRVFITGHTGFKGTWLCRLLLNLGADVTGYALAPPTDPNAYFLCDIENNIHSATGDIRDLARLKTAIKKAQPEIVLHMAAQPLVREGYKDPVLTYETNVMGTVNVLESIRAAGCVKSFLNVTTDKVYKNNEWCWGYRESEPLGGLDPYSNSKSCSELVTHSYRDSYFVGGDTALSTARAGNVIGGGDFAADRIIPDCVRAAQSGETIIVRNPRSIRPYQHVLEPLAAYLMIARAQYKDKDMAGDYNVGPDECDCVPTSGLATLFCESWGEGMAWEARSCAGPHEANYLKLDCSKIKSAFGWKPRWGIETAVRKTVEWTKVFLSGGDVKRCMDEQINERIAEERSAARGRL